MITCLLQGGLGNQMFQISATIGASYQNNMKYLFSSSNHYLPLQGRSVINYKDNIYSKINISDSYIENLNNFKEYREPSFSYNKIILNSDENYILNGYFQSEKYFQHIQKEIKDLFAPSHEIEKYLIEKYSLNKTTNYVSLHIRRGDYLKFPDVHPTCTQQYYRDAILKINDYQKIDKIFVFSDDLEWCKNVMNFSKKIVFVEEKYDYLEFYLMSLCNHNILANSSFSWWAAWLNKNPNKIIISPKIWFGKNGPQNIEDLIPEQWIKI